MTPQSLDALADAIVRTLARQTRSPQRDTRLAGSGGHDPEPDPPAADEAALAQAIADAVVERLAGGDGHVASRATRLLVSADPLAPLADALAARLATIGDGAELQLERIRI